MSVKVCAACKKSLPLDDFNRARNRADGRYNYCRSCTAERKKADRAQRPEVERERARRNYIKNRDERRQKMSTYYRDNAELWRTQSRKRALKAKYGITLEEYESLLAAQGGGCAVCGTTETVSHPQTGTPYLLSVDHDHATGRVRGILCRHCNLALGYAFDSPDRLIALARYLRRCADGTG